MMPKIDSFLPAEKFTEHMFQPIINRIFVEYVSIEKIENSSPAAYKIIGTSSDGSTTHIVFEYITNLGEAVNEANSLLTRGYFNSKPEKPLTKVTLKVPESRIRKSDDKRTPLNEYPNY
jgi:hypothetical protein